MTREKRPKRSIDFSVTLFDTSPGKPYVIKPATDPETIALRKSWPKGTSTFAQQHLGANIASEVIRFPFSDPEAQNFVFGKIATALVVSGWHSYAETAQSITRSAIDLPVLAEDFVDTGIEDWRETREGMMNKIHSGLGRTAAYANNLFLVHKNGITGNRYEKAQRDFGRTAASTALRMAALNLTPAQTYKTATKIQDEVVQVAVDWFDITKYAHHTNITHPSLAELADDPREKWLAGAPQQARDAFDQVFESPFVSR